MKQECLNCRWYKTDPRMLGLGHCRRHPPQVVVEKGTVGSIFPLTKCNDACGEWRYAIEAVTVKPDAADAARPAEDYGPDRDGSGPEGQ